MIKVGINGFGRIGRVCMRILLESDDFEVVAINDPVTTDNLCYLLNFDSHYGRIPEFEAEGDFLVRDDIKIPIRHEMNISEVDWNGATVVIDASGVTENVYNARNLSEGITSIVTHSPKDGVDSYIVMGVNDNEYDVSHKVISSSICDVNGAAQVIKPLDEKYGIENGFVTTLHPWLSYQNLIDGPVANQSNPGHPWPDYSLGRSSVGTMIPKNTSLIPALDNVIPEISKRVDAISFRTPTSIVSSADMTLSLKSDFEAEEVVDFLRGLRSEYIKVNERHLVGMDYLAMDEAVAIDLQWVRKIGSMLHLVIWYDNEWSYCSNTVKLARKVGS